MPRPTNRGLILTGAIGLVLRIDHDFDIGRVAVWGYGIDPSTDLNPHTYPLSVVRPRNMVPPSAPAELPKGLRCLAWRHR